MTTVAAYMPRTISTVEDAYEHLRTTGGLIRTTGGSYYDQMAAGLLLSTTDARWRVVPAGIVLVPVVGMGATWHGWSDSSPYEVIKVVSNITVDVRSMNAELDPSCKGKMGPGSGDDQKWIITSDPKGHVMRIRLNNKGRWAYKGNKFSLGMAHKYHDYNF